MANYLQSIAQDLNNQKRMQQMDAALNKLEKNNKKQKEKLDEHDDALDKIQRKVVKQRDELAAIKNMLSELVGNKNQANLSEGNILPAQGSEGQDSTVNSTNSVFGENSNNHPGMFKPASENIILEENENKFECKK